LRITRERLESLYGQDQKLDLLSLPEGGTMAHVRIPFRVQADGNGHPTPK
jgi:LytS/YehU family sensor histidine kinase